MRAKTSPLRRPPAPPAPEVVLEAGGGLDDDRGRIVARPDGYHWVALDGRQEFGPFESIEAAQSDLDGAVDDEDGAAGADDSVLEAEQDIGIADWIDPETGEPAEGQSRPHLGED